MSEVWIPEEHPIPRPHMEECGSFPEGCCPWMPEPCDCQCTCDDLISAYNRGVKDELERHKALSPNRHEMGVQNTRLFNKVHRLEETLERVRDACEANLSAIASFGDGSDFDAGYKKAVEDVLAVLDGDAE